jgi:hypothetical protein
VERVKSLLTSLLVTAALAVGASAQLVGNCPDLRIGPARQIHRLRGVLEDENLGVIPKAKVILQNGKLIELATVETDSNGAFDFGRRRNGTYRLILYPPVGLCRAILPIRLWKSGWNGVRVVVAVAPSDTCPQYCQDRAKIEKID